MLDILEKYPQISRTCSVFNPKAYHLTFAKNISALKLLNGFEDEIFVMVPQSISVENLGLKESLKIIQVDDSNLFFDFVKAHNRLNKDVMPRPDVVGKNCSIHNSVIIGVDGHNIAVSPEGEQIFMKHIGNVKIGNSVSIDAYTVIHRSIFDSTEIGDNVTICTQVNIGHNVVIGNNTFIAPGVKVAGSTKIGNNCKIWQGALIRNGINICDNVEIGMGSVVTKSIKEPGTYFGNSCIKQEK